MQTQSVELAGGPLTLVRVPSGSLSAGVDFAREESVATFWLSQTPITRGQYSAFADATGYKTESEEGARGTCRLAPWVFARDNA